MSGRHFHQFYTSDYKPQKFLSYFEKQTPQYKLTVENLYHKTLSFIDCNANINQGIIDTSFKEIKHSPASNCFMSSSFISNSVSTLNFIVNNSNLSYIFDNALHKYLFFFFFIENQTSDSQENANLCFSPIFRTAKNSTIDRNINFYYHIIITFNKILII